MGMKEKREEIENEGDRKVGKKGQQGDGVREKTMIFFKYKFQK